MIMTKIAAGSSIRTGPGNLPTGRLTKGRLTPRDSPAAEGSNARELRTRIARTALVAVPQFFHSVDFLALVRLTKFRLVRAFNNTGVTELLSPKAVSLTMSVLP